MAVAAGWVADVASEVVLDRDSLRFGAAFAVLAANFVLMALPPTIAALVLLGLVR